MIEVEVILCVCVRVGIRIQENMQSCLARQNQKDFQGIKVQRDG